MLVDVSGSMTAPLSRRSEMQRTDAAYGLAVLLREIGEKVAVFSLLRTTWSRCRRVVASPCATQSMQSQPHGAHVPRQGRGGVERSKERYDRLIVITDEQAHDTVPAPKGKGYVINVASYKNGVGYGKWTHIDGWSRVGRRVHPHAGDFRSWVLGVRSWARDFETSEGGGYPLPPGLVESGGYT